MAVQTGLDRLLHSKELQDDCGYAIGYLCHNASITASGVDGLTALYNVFGDRLQAVFSPQHGLFGEAQDNMIESPHYTHPFFKIPVHSLYEAHRTPTPEMLEALDQVIVDLQDIGTRPYTYIYTMQLMMAACAEAKIPVWVLDRPNPIRGEKIEGNLLDTQFSSFIGLLPLPTRHSLTIAEIARLVNAVADQPCNLRIIKLEGWNRAMTFHQTGLTWANPSPNMPTVLTAQVFPGMVFWEGTNWSEGRGTTRPFEIFGTPRFDPYGALPGLEKRLTDFGLKGFKLRPVYFEPTFEKHAGQRCGGYQLHILGPAVFQPWLTGLCIMQYLFHLPDAQLAWRQPPFEYEYNLLPIDILNGSDQVRQWIESHGTLKELQGLELKGREDFLHIAAGVKLY
ncbi:MAG: DUF1343 domain-containing protein [Mameliella sp.]|nr:DUF1343 domain-containing protein [Phaeodactylibacter sp.]